MAVADLGEKRACDERAGIETDRASWPPPRPFWVTRDASVSGELDDGVDVWTAPPERFTITGFVGGYWLSSEWDLSTRWGRYTATSFRRWAGVGPDTDRECLRFG